MDVTARIPAFLHVTHSLIFHSINYRRTPPKLSNHRPTIVWGSTVPLFLWHVHCNTVSDIIANTARKLPSSLKSRTIKQTEGEKCLLSVVPFVIMCIHLWVWLGVIGRRVTVISRGLSSCYLQMCNSNVAGTPPCWWRLPEYNAIVIATSVPGYWFRSLTNHFLRK